jgi:hypothetical protein
LRGPHCGPCSAAGECTPSLRSAGETGAKRSSGTRSACDAPSSAFPPTNRIESRWYACW